jgi:hypothetical protein
VTSNSGPHRALERAITEPGVLRRRASPQRQKLRHEPRLRPRADRVRRALLGDAALVEHDDVVGSFMGWSMGMGD